MKTTEQIGDRIAALEESLAAQDAHKAAGKVPPETAAMIFALRREIEALRWVLA